MVAIIGCFTGIVGMSYLAAQALKAIAFATKVQSAEARHQAYMSSYTAAVNLAADHFSTSGKFVEQTLLEIQNLLKEESEILQACARAEVRTLLRRTHRRALEQRLDEVVADNQRRDTIAGQLEERFGAIVHYYGGLDRAKYRKIANSTFDRGVGSYRGLARYAGFRVTH